MNLEAFWKETAKLGLVRVISRAPVGMMEVDVRMDELSVSEKFVNVHAGPIGLHLKKDTEVVLHFEDGRHEHTGNVEHGIVMKDTQGADVGMVFLLRDPDTGEFDPECVGAYRALRAKAEGKVPA